MMDKKRWLMTAALGLLLSAGACVQAQQAPKNRMHNTPAPLTPALAAILLEDGRLSHAAAVDLHLHNYAQAESEARDAIATGAGDGVPPEVLAAALEAQGKDKEALQQYENIVERYDRNSRNLLPYALLLLKSGQWAKAVTAYNHTLLDTDRNELGEQLPLFSQEVPQPTALATAIHLERGDLYNSSDDWAGNTQHMEAMTEYAQALQLAPDNALANYYYGTSWHKLSLAERVKFGHAAQAEAALQKAVQSDDPSVKKMAAEALERSN